VTPVWLNDRAFMGTCLVIRSCVDVGRLSC